MILGKHWALCEVTEHYSFIEAFSPFAYLSKELCDNLVFLKPYSCDLVVDKKKYEFNVLPLTDEQKKPENKSIFYSTHEISIPSEFFELISESLDNACLVRTDIF
ncbi:MAG: hypothetical protein PHG04_03875 [Candidatus Nanoarchaeia archaeon]|nr:hypothetical protein [Candidatus Nanoarchaeia archaeon]MDD5054484.1 hypothetical protein [Candidatus Nanoarchaeia archaeon]